MRILLVEDEPSQQEALGIALTVSGYTVLPATDVQEALALIDEPLDAAILDRIFDFLAQHPRSHK